MDEPYKFNLFFSIVQLSIISPSSVISVKNLKEFTEALILIEANATPNFTYRRKFEKTSLIPFTCILGNDYLLQEVYNSKKSIAENRNSSLRNTEK